LIVLHDKYSIFEYFFRKITLPIPGAFLGGSMWFRGLDQKAYKAAQLFGFGQLYGRQCLLDQTV